MSQTATSAPKNGLKGLAIERRFSSPGTHPFDEIEWEVRDALIGDPAKPAFEQRGVEFPKSWSQNATNIVAQKYFRGQLGSPERESSVKQMVGRVAGTISGWGREGGYFASDEDADAFEAELTSILLNQKAAFNSPVWFNVGFEERPQCSACFILSVEDNMESILELEHQGGQDLPRRLGLGDQPLQHPRLDGAAAEGRHGERPGQLHARRRRLGGDDQVGRQDAAGGEDGRARRRPPRHRALHLVQGRRGEEGRGAARRRLRHVDRRRGLHLDPVPEREQLGAGDRRVHGGGRSGRGLGPAGADDRRRGEDAAGARADGPDRRRRLALRRPGRPVRHDHQPLAHLPGVGADQRLQPVQRVHARRRLGLQPRLAQPDEVPPRGRQSSTSRTSSTRSTSSSSPRRSSSATPPTRPRRSPRTPTASASSGSATPTSARC